MLTDHLDWASNATRDSWQVVTVLSTTLTTAPSKCHWQHVLEIYHFENSSGEWSSFNAAEEGSSDREQFYVLYLLLSCCLCLAKYRKVVSVVLLMFWGRGRSFLRILALISENIEMCSQLVLLCQPHLSWKYPLRIFSIPDLLALVPWSSTIYIDF